jgi:hypothetical protein
MLSATCQVGLPVPASISRESAVGDSCGVGECFLTQAVLASA